MDHPHVPIARAGGDLTRPSTDARPMRVVVLGTGYVGLTAAACLAELGHRVTGLDVDEALVERLGAGIVHIVEEGLADLVGAGLASGNLSFAAAPAAAPTVPAPGGCDGSVGGIVDTASVALARADVVLLCLPTPTRADGSLDVAFVEGAARWIGPILAPGAVVVTKSTVPVGTHVALAEWLDRDDIAVVSNPEFLREGTAVRDFAEPDRVVVGGDDPAAVGRVAALYATIDAPVLTMDAASAELVKVGANAFLAARLSMVNELSRLCERVGADIDDVTAGLGSDHRIGATFLRPGPGWGGSCFPKDTRGLVHLAASVGLRAPVVEAAIESNEEHVAHVVATVAAAAGGTLRGRRIAVWGLTFKAGTDDCRDSPALRVVEGLVAAGAEVVATDPAARVQPSGVRIVADAAAAAEGADVVVVATEWPEFAAVDLADVADGMRGAVIVDTRDVIDPLSARCAGLTLRRLGRTHGDVAAIVDRPALAGVA
ncbi:MAG: UDP-glucose dehydrogenase family protein [Acidimicrobiales bacterium]